MVNRYQQTGDGALPILKLILLHILINQLFIFKIICA